ncbi:type VI secretion-associated protein [Acinetobacter sp. ANC 4558]|uniref:type VI secretion system-associated protein TagF n=1 Tax=Acinetobacter sp. ANC 4558 TaxID=1977876 RepID=UPI000A33C0B5|nr:type VI secretion system-associated protein TagF [Acinetobacter sp. ANC 4558]OTG86378.1 type VI secretion-associated protein [Acinetobacter sp. ANC 4558]
MDLLKAFSFYYGKIPCHGDFLKSKGQSALIQLFDQWISEALEQAMKSSDFQNKYLTCPTFDFFITNPQEPMFVVANLIASKDYSDRCFPMLLGYVLEIDKPEANLLFAPFRYKSILINLLLKNKAVYQLSNTEQLLKNLDELKTELEVPSLIESKAIFDNHTMYSFAKLMDIPLYELARSIIGLGLLLQPISEKGVQQLNKVLTIPMSERFRSEIAAFWVNLIGSFLSKHHVEVLFGIIHSQKPMLVFGFQGAAIQTLSDIFLQDYENSHWVQLINSQWVDEYVQENASLAWLEQTLCERQLSLNHGIRLFRQYFIDGSL